MFKGTKQHHKTTISRALIKLEESGWILKEGKGTRKTSYKINRAKKEIAEIITKLESIPNPNDTFYPVEVDLNALASEIYEKRNDFDIECALPHLEIVIAGEKIDGFEKSVKHLEKNYKLLAEIVKFMNFIAIGRATQAMQNYKTQMQKQGKDVNTEEAKKEIFFMGYLHKKNWKPFKLIISWSPERYGYLESCPLGFNWKLLKTTKN